jgi:hypothetical protein
MTDAAPSVAERGSVIVGGDDGVDGLDRGEVADDAVAHDGDRDAGIDVRVGSAVAARICGSRRLWGCSLA